MSMGVIPSRHEIARLYSRDTLTAEPILSRCFQPNSALGNPPISSLERSTPKKLYINSIFSSVLCCFSPEPRQPPSWMFPPSKYLMWSLLYPECLDTFSLRAAILPRGQFPLPGSGCKESNCLKCHSFPTIMDCTLKMWGKNKPFLSLFACLGFSVIVTRKVTNASDRTNTNSLKKYITQIKL